MNLLLTVLLVVFLACSFSLAAEPDTDARQLETATDLQVRDGLANVGEKLKAGKPVTVVWVGGSITQCGDNGKNGYVVRVSNWLNEQYPEAELNVVNAGISGTGSDFGAKRFDRDVLKHAPDLVLIEFCVNDGDADRTRDMERMVHKAWLKDATIDIAFFYTLADRHLPQYKQGELPFAASCHERVAEHYGIPTIGTAKVVADAVNAGTIEWNQFANDGCHPNPNGYGMFVEHFKTSLPTLLAAGKAGKHKLSEPLSESFVVYPPKLKAEPFTPPTFKNADGEQAKTSYALPAISRHWVGEPQFDSADGKALWRLAWMDRTKATTDDTCGLERKLWDGNEMEWFGEDKCFTGPGGQALIHARGGKGNHLGLAQKEAAVLVFIAPETGRYAFDVTSPGVGTWKSDEKIFSLQVAKFDWGKEQGRSLAFYRNTKADAKDIHLTGEIEMTAGEELVFIPATNAPWYIGGGWNDLKVGIGYYGATDK
jgi:lysophospholipase L1-like esterase